MTMENRLLKSRVLDLPHMVVEFRSRMQPILIRRAAPVRLALLDRPQLRQVLAAQLGLPLAKMAMLPIKILQINQK